MSSIDVYGVTKKGRHTGIPPPKTRVESGWAASITWKFEASQNANVWLT